MNKPPYSASFAPLDTLGAGIPDQRLQGFFEALVCWALKECESYAEIYENTTF